MQLLSILSGIIVGMMSFGIAYKIGYENGMFYGTHKAINETLKKLDEAFTMTPKE